MQTQPYSSQSSAPQTYDYNKQHSVHTAACRSLQYVAYNTLYVALLGVASEVPQNVIEQVI